MARAPENREEENTMTRLLTSLAALCLLAGAVVAQSPSNPLPVNWKGLPEPFATESARNNPTVLPAKPDGASLTVPPGFIVEEYLAFPEQRPRFMILGPTNEILLSDTSRNGSIYVLKDGTKTAIIEKLDRPYG